MDEECIHEAKIGRKEIIEAKVDAKGVCIQIGEENLPHLEPTVHKDPAFDGLIIIVEDALDYNRCLRMPNEMRVGEDSSVVSPKIDPKDKDKKVIEKKEAGSDDESGGKLMKLLGKKFDQLAKDEEIARKARIKADRLLAARLQEEERETFTIKDLMKESKGHKKKRGTKKRKSGYVKMIIRKKARLQPNDDSDDEHRKCLRIVTFDTTLDSEIMETKSFVSKLHKVSSPDGDIMMESSTEENNQGDFWNNQQDWEIISWRLYEVCGVCILELKDGTSSTASLKEGYPLSKGMLQRMLDMGLVVV
ncbi:hypothetical protein Tco_0221092 [Tanacetum coccineum]